ncbi:hypothetical protein VTL71DRAFT_4882 [Oculimacula yallundae]|uniref:Uncharacterized protein n=1 Tax=Oculimacula yallundae TaxID=86028 RepID=A0ABR4C5M1_9HELO
MSLRPDHEANSLAESRAHSLTTSADGLTPKQTSFSPRVAVRQRQTLASPLGFKIDFTALPAMEPISPMFPPEDLTSNGDSPLVPPPRSKSCPTPLLAPPNCEAMMATPKSGFYSITRPGSTRPPQPSKSPGMETYDYPVRQPQPDPSWLPAAINQPPRPTYLRTARDRTTAVYGALHPVMNISHPPPTPNPQDIQVQRARAARRLVAEPVTSSPLALVYDTRSKIFSFERRSNLLPNQSTATPMIEMQENLPPMLVDGRMTVVQLPRWSKTMVLFWRSCDGKNTKVRKKEIELPIWVWMARNSGNRKWKECFIRGD